MTSSERQRIKDIVRLLRFVGNAGCRVCAVDAATGPAGRCTVTSAGGAQAGFDRTVLQAAVRLGLLLARGDRIFATAEARPFMRRYLAAREEAFLDQHRIVEVAEVRQGDSTHPVRINASASPLSALARLKDAAGRAWFGEDALAAGERLAGDFLYANLQPKITASYAPRLGNRTGAAPGAGVEMKDSVVAARLRVSRAIAAMGPELSGVALDVCCFEKGLELVERERQWPARSAKLMLKTALLQLHRHYHPPVAATRLRHAWVGEGYQADAAG